MSARHSLLNNAFIVKLQGQSKTRRGFGTTGVKEVTKQIAGSHQASATSGANTCSANTCRASKEKQQYQRINALNGKKKEAGYLVSRGTLLPSTQLSCSGTLSGGVACSSAGDWPATGAGLPVGGVSCRVELSDWPAWWAELSEWLSAVMEGCWRWGGGTGGRAAPW